MSDTITDVLKRELRRAGSLCGVERGSGVTRPSLSKFLRGKQSLRLDMADKLAAYLGIECRVVRRKA